jgi:hypothetical protein
MLTLRLLNIQVSHMLLTLNAYCKIQLFWVKLCQVQAVQSANLK